MTKIKGGTDQMDKASEFRHYGNAARPKGRLIDLRR